MYIALVIFTSILYFISFFMVKFYYEQGLPYYDSVGSYWNMFSVMNTTRDIGIIEGIRLASEYSLSWLQSFFAVFVSFILPKTPQALILLNFICLGIAQISIYRFIRIVGYAKEKAITLAFLPLLPGALWSWYGGYIDMRRDASFVSLLTATFFSFAVCLYKPTVKRGIAAGMLIGLTQWSRGNAAPYLVIILISVLAGYLYSFPNIKKKSIVKSLLITVISSFVLLLPYYAFNIREIFTKYLYGSWALGENRIRSLGYVVSSFPMLLLGTSKAAAKISTYFFIAFIVISIVVVSDKKIFLDKIRHETKPLVLAGFIIILATIFFNGVVLGFNRFAGPIPNYPILVGVYAVSIAVFVNLKIKKLNSQNITKVSILFIISIVFLNALRIRQANPQTDPAKVIIVKKVADDLANTLSGRWISYIWIDHINVHDLNFYLTQKGYRPIRASSGLAMGADIEMPFDPNRSIEKQREDFVYAIRTRPFIVVTDYLSGYEDKNSQFFIFRFGRPVIEGIINDPKLKKIYSYDDGNRNYILLENQFL